MDNPTNFDNVLNRFQVLHSTYIFNIDNFTDLINYYIIKYPVKKFFCNIESTPIKLSYENGKLLYTKIKHTKLGFQNSIFSQEFFKIDFNKKQIDYQEEQLKQKDSTLIEQQLIYKKDNKYIANFLHIMNKNNRFKVYVEKAKNSLVKQQRNLVIKQVQNYTSEMEELLNYSLIQFKQFYQQNAI